MLSGPQFEERVILELSTLLPPHFYEDNFEHSPLSMVTSCNGIICLSCEFPSGKLQVALWNPATKQLACLPEPPLFSTACRFCQVVFGYDVKADVYKVVQIGVFLNPDYSSAYCLAHAFDLQADFWRNVDVHLPSGLRFTARQTVNWKGHFSWLVHVPKGNGPNTIYLILSFNLSNEVFGTMELPDVISDKQWEPHLATIGDSVACIARMNPSICDETYSFVDHHFVIWVLREYGVKESWTKLHTIELFGPFTQPIGFSKNGKLVLFLSYFESGSCLMLYDPSSKEIKNLHIGAGYVSVYKETLVSVKKMVHL